jgi:hypothetical protein
MKTVLFKASGDSLSPCELEDLPHPVNVESRSDATFVLLLLD